MQLRVLHAVRAVAAGIAVAGIATVLPLGRLRPAVADGTRELAPPMLLESPSCQAAAMNEGRPTATSSPAGSMALTVTVPPVAVMHVDDRNRIVSAMTNTGCAPRTTDQLWLVAPDGRFVAASPELASAHRWVGDFRMPGVNVKQAPGPDEPSGRSATS
jgi:hypothetical protein